MPIATSTALALAALGASTGASVYGAKKAANAAKLDPQTQAYQNEALRLKNARMAAAQPLYEKMIKAAPGRMAASMGGEMSPYLQNPNVGQAVSRLARELPGPRRRTRYGDAEQV